MGHEDESPRKPTAAEEVLAYEQRVDEQLRKFYNRTEWEPSTDQTPLSHLLASEDGQLDEWAIQAETARRLLSWIAADGPHPAQLLRRLYLLGDHMMIQPYCELTLRDKAILCNNSHGTQHWLMKRICVNPLVRKGALSVKAPRQKGRAASAAAAVAQKGNTNRKDSVTGDGKRLKKTRDGKRRRSTHKTKP
jgi:hypothetical protein